MSKKETYFQKDWLQMPEFAQWLHDVKDDNTTAGYKRYLKKDQTPKDGKVSSK